MNSKCQLPSHKRIYSLRLKKELNNNHLHEKNPFNSRMLRRGIRIVGTDEVREVGTRRNRREPLPFG